MSLDSRARQFLSEEVAPLLRRAQRPRLAGALHRAASVGTLAPLARLSVREKRELLEAIERGIERRRPFPSPSTLVRITTALSAAGTADLGGSRPPASPSR